MQDRINNLQGRFDALERIPGVENGNYKLYADNILDKLKVVNEQIDDLKKEVKTVPFELQNDIGHLESAIKSRIEAKQ